MTARELALRRCSEEAAYDCEGTSTDDIADDRALSVGGVPPLALTREGLAILQELERLQEDSTYAGQAQFETAKQWQALGWLIGVPAAALAAAAGFTGLASVTGRVPAAILALIAAGLGGIITTVQPSRRMQRARTAGIGYNELRVTLRQLRLIDLPQLSDEEGRARLQDVTAMKSKIDGAADLPNALAFWRARRNVAKGRLSHQADASGQGAQ